MGFRDTLDRIVRRDFTGATRDERATASRDVIAVCALASAGLTLQPIPGLEQGVIPIQIAMVIGIAHVHGEPLSRKRAREVLLDLGATTGVNLLGRQALATLGKVVLPGLGGALAAPSTFAITWATGHAAAHYFESGGRVDRARIKKIFEEEKRRGRGAYSEGAARRERPEATDVKDG